MPPGVFEAIRDRIATGDDRAFFVGNAATAIETVEKWDRHLGGLNHSTVPPVDVDLVALEMLIVWLTCRSELQR
jgi:hypothetical protein